MENELIFHHIGIACFDIEASKNFYVAQGYVASETIEDPIQGVLICFLYKPGMPRLELLAPIDENSPVNRTLAASGVTPYHMCYEVSNIEAAVKDFKVSRFVVVSNLVGDKRVCFLYNKNVGLIELLEA